MTDSNLSSRLLVLVCTYNELRNLPALVESISIAIPGANILVVDDGSPDGTGKWLEDSATRYPNLRWIQRGRKLGLGTAIKAGLQYAMEQGFEAVINLDADFSHDPMVLPQFWQVSQQTRADLVIGSRYVSGGGLKNCSWRRHLVSRGANLYARCVVGWSVRDCSSAYRCYRTAFLRQLDWAALRCDGYGFLEEILWSILKAGGKVVETPIVYTEREEGDSKISLREATGTLAVLHRLALQRLKSVFGSERTHSGN